MYSLGVGGIQDAEQQLNEEAIEIQAPSQKALVK